MTDHFQPNALDLLIESREIPAVLRGWADGLRHFRDNGLLEPETYAEHFYRMADKIERDCNRLEYHLKMPKSLTPRMTDNDY